MWIFPSRRSHLRTPKPPRKPLSRAGEAIRNFMEKAAGMRHPRYKRVRKRQWKWWKVSGSWQNYFWKYFSTGLDFKAFTWLRDFLRIFPKIAVRQTVGVCGAAEGNSKPCKPFSPTQYKDSENIQSAKSRNVSVDHMDIQVGVWVVQHKSIHETSKNATLVKVIASALMNLDEQKLQ